VTAVKFWGDEIVIELHTTAVFMRTKGRRESFPIPHTDLYDIAAMRHAKRVSGFAGSRRRPPRFRHQSSFACPLSVWALCGPGDTPDPVLTVILPHED
jgi:hypothetical protein